MAESAGTGAWLPIIAASVIFAAAVSIITYLGNLFKEKTLFEYSQLLVGKFVTFIFTAIYIIYFFGVSTLVNRVTSEVIKADFLPKTPIWAISLIILAVSSYAASKGISNLGRLFEFYGIIVLILAMATHTIMILHGDLRNILPLFDVSETGKYFKSIFSTILAFLGFEVLTAIPMSKQNSKRRYFYTAGAILAAGLFYIYTVESSFSIVGVNDIVNYNDSLIVAIRRVDVDFLQFLKRMDLVFILGWLMSIFCTISILTYTTNEYICKILPKTSKYITLIALFVLVFIGGLIPKDFEAASKFLTFLAEYFGLASALFIPLFLLFVSKVKNMQVRTISYFFIIIYCFLALTGCWDAEDIQEKNIATSVVTDYDNGKYYLWIEIAKIKGIKQTGEVQKGKESFSILKSEGTSLIETRDEIDRKSDRPIYLGATRIIILTDRLAEKGIEEYMNRIRGTIDYRKTIDVANTSSSPDEFLKIIPENDISVGFSMENTLKNMDDNGNGIHVSVGDILQYLSVKKAGFIIPKVDIKEDEHIFTGYSVFKNAKKIGFIPAEERKGLIYLIAKNPKFNYEVEYKDEKLAMNTLLKKRKINPIFEQGKLTFEVTLEFEGQIDYMEKVISIDYEDEKKLEKALESLIKVDIDQALDKAQKVFSCDYLEFYKYFRIHYPEAFKNIDWNEVFSKSKIAVQIHTDIKAAGMLEISPKTSR
jgi:spore germination protein